MGYSDRCDISAMVGETLTAVAGCEKGSGEIVFTAASGRTFLMHHYQDCCENVLVEDVVGDVSDLIGSPLTVAREDSDAATEPPPAGPDGPPESCTWTFYNLATVKGYVTLRWLGRSNGYYSERVDFEETTVPATD